MANLLLAATVELRRDRRQWLPIPRPDLREDQLGVRWTLEVAKRGMNLTQISGWAFPEDDQLTRSSAPCLLAVGENTAWIMPGLMVERPDVLSVFPASGLAASNRLKSGFAFELSTGLLPENILVWRVMIGIVNRPPLVTPDFQLT